MNKEWQLPPAYESTMQKSNTIAESLIGNFAEGSFASPDLLITSVTEYFCSQDDAENALKRFTTHLGYSHEDFDASDDPRFQVTLVIGIVTVWASSETESRYPAFRALVQNSWWVEHFWTEVALVLALKNDAFKDALLNLAEQHFADAEKKLLQEYGVDPSHSITLDEIWYGHARESRIDDSSWPWVELLAKLDLNQLFKWMSSTKSLVLINRVLDSPEFYRNYDLWEQFTYRSPKSFQSDGSWDGALLLPSLLRHGSMKLIHIADGHGYPLSMLESHVESLLASFVDTVAKRSDFEGLFKRWGTWLTRQYLNFPDNNSDLKRSLSSQDIFWGLADKLPLSWSSPTVSEQLNSSWEPWVYQSMLALLHSNQPDRFPAPDVRDFINEWNLTPTEWNSSKGQSIRSHVSEYYATQPGSYACRVLGYSVALSGDFTSHWLNMWNSSVALREILEFRPIYKISEEWQPSDASKLMRTLVDVGLGILDCTANAQETLNPEILKQSAALFQALWEATTEMLSIDFYGNDFWPIMQQHLVIRRLQWAVEANANDDSYSILLDKAAYPTSREILTLVASNPCSFISLLPLLVQNQIPKEYLKDLLNQTEIDLASLASSADRYESGPKMKFKIHSGHVSLIEELA